MTVRFAEHHGRRIHYAEVGTGRSVVLVPGLGAGMSLFGTLPRRFARAGYRCITFDPVGIPPSSPSAEGYSFASAAEDLLAVVDATGAKPCFAIGTSLGGKVVLAAARQSPSHWRRLALLASAAQVSARARRIYAFFARVTQAPPEAFGDLIAPFLFGSTFHQQQSAVVEDILRALQPSPQSRQLMAAQCQELMRWSSTELDMQSALPTLCMAGAEDTLTLPEEVQATAQALGGARYECVAQAGHSLLLESRRAFELLCEFDVESAP